MISLWLDDTRTMPSDYTHWAKTAQEAIELLNTGEVEECSLDFDLGIGHDTGLVVAKWIEEQANAGTLKPIRCYVHSQSYDGKMAMKLALQGAYKAWMKNGNKHK